MLLYCTCHLIVVVNGVVVGRRSERGGGNREKGGGRREEGGGR